MRSGSKRARKARQLQGVRGHGLPEIFMKFKTSEIAENAFNFVNHW